MKQKGFTLLEILAVVTILGLIIATIVPIVGGSLKQSKKNITIDSAKSYINAYETYLKATALRSELTKYPAGQAYQVASETQISGVTYPAVNNTIGFNGEAPTGGTITPNDNYAVASANLTIGDYTVIYDGKTKEYVIKND